MSKLSSDTVREAVVEILKYSLETKQRKFKETIELQIGLKNFDPARDRRLTGSVRLPHLPKKNFKVCVLGSEKHCEDAAAAGAGSLNLDALKKFNRDKKLVKKLAKENDAFLASSTLIRQIPRLLGPGLNKAGKFPTVLGASDAVEDKITELAATVKFALKFKTGMPMSVSIPVANVDMTEDEIVENTVLAVNYVVSVCKKHWQNIKRIHIKSTMGPSQRVFGF